MRFRSIEFQSDEFREALALRDALLRKPLGLVYSGEDIEEERNHFHLVGIDEATNAIVAVLLLASESGNFSRVRMRQVAVAESHQGTGVGQRLVAFAESFASEHGYSEMHLHAREHVVGFYEKLGYQTVGDRFEEVGIPHFKMWKSITPGC